MRILLGLVFLSGCGALGPYRYTGSSTGISIKESVRAMPEPHSCPPGSGKVFDYWRARVEKSVEISNGSDVTYYATVTCTNVQFSGPQNVEVPPHSYVMLSVSTTAFHAYDQLCSLD